MTTRYRVECETSRSLRGQSWPEADALKTHRRDQFIGIESGFILLNVHVETDIAGSPTQTSHGEVDERDPTSFTKINMSSDIVQKSPFRVIPIRQYTKLQDS